MIQNLLTNWKTTSLGITTIAGATIHLIFAIKAGAANENTWTITMVAWVTGLGLLVAGDGSQSVQKTNGTDATAAPAPPKPTPPTTP